MDDQCPSDEVLARFVRAVLPEAESERIAEHLETCEICDETVSRLERREHEAIGRAAGDSWSNLSPVQVSLAAARRYLTALKRDDNVGDCRLIQELGAGAFARVFLAEQTAMRRFVALKISARASNEPKLLSQLNHRHIVRVLHYDDRSLADRGLHLMYMQLVPGCSLKDVLSEFEAIVPAERTGDLLLSTIQRLTAEVSYTETSRRPTTSPLAGSDWASAVCWMGARLADALSYAHALGVLHRDIKPANILLLPDGSPMLLDFNVGFGADVEGMQPDDDFGGSLAYMSPEQLAAFHRHVTAACVTESSDIYSLAVVLFELMTGTRPRAVDTLDATTTVTLPSDQDCLESRSQYLEQLTIACPRGLREFLEKGLYSDPAARPSSARIARQLQLDTNEEVQKLLANRPTRWISRYPLFAPFVMLLVAGLLPNGVIAVLNYQFNKTNTNLDKELLAEHHYYVNAVVFSLGIIVLATACLPVFKAIIRGRDSACASDEWEKVSKRCLLMGSYFAKVILTLWVSTGAIYPTLDALRRPRELDTHNLVEFFVSQLLHGLLASSITFFLVTFLATRVFFPRLLRAERPLETCTLLTRLLQLVDHHGTVLALTPSCALIALALFDDRERYLLLMLGGFGAIGYGVAFLLTPIIRATTGLLAILLTPTKQLLYGDNSDTRGF